MATKIATMNKKYIERLREARANLAEQKEDANATLNATAIAMRKAEDAFRSAHTMLVEADVTLRALVQVSE